MMSVFSRAGAGIQSVLFFLNGGYLPAGRELSPRTRIGPFHRPPYCLRQQGPTPADTCFGNTPLPGWALAAGACDGGTRML